MKKMVRRFVWTLIVIAAVILGGLGYLGFVPGVSAVFGSNTPADLQSAPATSDQQSANTKFHQTFIDTSSLSGTDAGFAILSAAKANTVDTMLTGQEVAAHVMETHPVSDLQVRFNSDGTFEAAGKIDKGRIDPMINALGFTNIDQLQILATINKYIPGSPTIYLKGTGSVSNDQATLSLDTVKLGRLSVSPAPFAKGLVAYANAVMMQVPGFDANSVTLEAGQLHYVGTAPSQVPSY